MKAVLWTKIAPTQIANTFWKTVYEKPDIEDKIRAEIDLEELCDKFKLSSPKTNQTTPPSSTTSSQPKTPTHISVLDAKRNNNICRDLNINININNSLKNIYFYN